MSELRKIEQKIFLEDKIEFLLEELECWDIRAEQRGKLYTAGLPDGDNSRSVQIKNNESLSSSIRSKGVSGSIYDIISYIKFGADTKEKYDACLHKSKFWICETLGYFEFVDDFYRQTSDNVDKGKPNYTAWLKKINKSENKKELVNELKQIDIDKVYGNVPYFKWYQEGLSVRTQRLFQVGVDVQSERITFPIHNKDGEVIGVKGRYFGKNKEIEDKYKYLYLVPCNKSLELFNFHRALPHIMERKEVIIVEGGKTAMFLTQWNYPNSVGIEGDSLSDVQVKLLKGLGIGIKYIFALDKDKNAEYVKKEVVKLTGRMKYGIIDTSSLLQGKDSPTDRGKEVWDKLYKENIYKIS